MSPKVLILVFLIVAASVVLILLFLKPELFDSPADGSQQETKTRPHKGPGYKRSPGEDELSRLLAMFELTDAATEADIKAAYRRKMKELHPDSSSAGDPEAFRELRKAYDRLLVIKNTRFGRSF